MAAMGRKPTLAERSGMSSFARETGVRRQTLAEKGTVTVTVFFSCEELTALREVIEGFSSHRG